MISKHYAARPAQICALTFGVLLALIIPVTGLGAQESPPPSSGYLVVSIGPSSTMDTVSLFTEYASDDGKIDNRVYWSSTSPFPNDYNSGNGDRGFVFVWPLPPGQYHFYRIEEEDGFSVYWWKFRLPFTISAGRVTYAGDFRFIAQQGRGFLGMPIAKGGYLAVSNESNRDIPIAARKATVPNLADFPLDVVRIEPNVLQTPPFCMSVKPEILTPGTDVPLCPEPESKQ